MTQGPISIAMALAGMVLLAQAATAEPVTVTDATGRTVSVHDTSRIVSVGGSITEILYELGLEEQVVAVDDTSTWPPRARAEKPSVGYLRALSPEGVLSLGGSVIIADAGAGPPETIAVLENASVPVVRIPSEPSLQGILDKIALVAEVTGQTESGAALMDSVRRNLESVQEEQSAVGEPLRVMFVLSVRDGRIMAAGADTAAAAVLELAGARNAFPDFSGYRPVSSEAILKAAPQAIVMMTGGDHATSADELFALPALAGTPAAAERRLVTMDGLYLLGFGPRTADAVRDLAATLYPQSDLRGKRAGQ